MVEYEGSSNRVVPIAQSKEDKMSDKELTREQAAVRGKRLLMYGMFALVLVTVVTLFLLLWFWLAPVGYQNVAIQTTLIVGAVAIVACVVVWFVYTKVVLKE